MNLVLFQKDEIGRPLPIGDERTTHILKVLKRQLGELFDAGIVNGARGKGRITGIDKDRLSWDFEPTEEPPPLFPVTLITGIPRPQIARRILREATILGVERMLFVGTDRGERSYSRSRLWRDGEYRRHLLLGAQQAFCTRLPDVALFPSLSDCLAATALKGDRIALDNYEATTLLRDYGTRQEETAIAVGSERGWSDTERSTLREAGFTLVSLGPRVLSQELACSVSVGMVLQAFE